MYHQLRIDSLTKKGLDEIKESLSHKSYNETIYSLIHFVNKNQFDIQADYTDNIMNFFEIRNNKVQKRMEDLITILRNIERNSIVPTSKNVIEIRDNYNKLLEVNQKENFVNSIDKKSEKELEQLKNDNLKLKKQLEILNEKIQNHFILSNEITTSITKEANFLNSNQLKISLKAERFNEICELIRNI